jgi:phage gp37-like protein
MALLDNADIGHHSELQHVRQGLSYGTSFSAMGMSCKASTPQAKHSSLKSMSADARIFDSFD